MAQKEIFMRTTKTKKTTKQDPLSQLEAKMVADFLVQKTHENVHWTTLWRMSPDEISEKYPVTLKDVTVACRRSVPV